MKSKTGLYFSIAFIIVTVIADLYAYTHIGDSGSTIIYAFSYPWIYFLLGNNWGLFLAQAINIIPIYFIGALVGFLHTKIKSSFQS